MLQKHVFLRDLNTSYKVNVKLNFDMCIPEIKTAIEFNGYFTHSSENQQISDAFKEEWCKNNDFKLIVIRTNPTFNQPVGKHVVDNITYYDINKEKYKCKNGNHVINNNCTSELNEVIRDIVSNID